MAEEIRFFLRTAIYTLTITVIYWFLSYEIAGSALLLSLGLSAIFFVVVGFVMIRHAKEDPLPDDTRPANVIQRTLGFDEPEGETVRPPLALEDEPIPSSSIWPLADRDRRSFPGTRPDLWRLDLGPWHRNSDRGSVGLGDSALRLRPQSRAPLRSRPPRCAATSFPSCGGRAEPRMTAARCTPCR